MTSESWHEVFVKCASTGVALGLAHRYEWFANAVRMLQHGDYTKIQESRKQIEEAFLAFEKTTACCDPDQLELDALDIDGYYTEVNNWYADAGRKY